MLKIITVTKNDIQGITRTIHSTQSLRQNYNVKQIIIDSSDQQIHQNLTQSIGKEKNLKLYYQDPQGIAKAFNYGIEIASDGWLWFLNGGEEVHPALNIELLNQLLIASKADIVIFSIEIFNKDDDKVIIETRHPSLPDLWPPTYNWIPHPGTIIKKTSILQCGKFREDFEIAMDTELWLRLFDNVVTDLISMTIAKFYTGGISSNVLKSSQETLKIVKLHWLRFFKNWIKKGLMLIDAYSYHKNIVKKQP